MRIGCILVAAILLGGCASSVSPQPHEPDTSGPSEPPTDEGETSPDPLIDRSGDTDYHLSEVALQMDRAETYAAEGKRAAAAAVLSGARARLPEEAWRERAFLQLRTAEVWGAPGQGRNGEKAAAILAEIKTTAEGDPRLAADLDLALAVLDAGGGRLDEAEGGVLAGLTGLETVSAHLRYVEACRRALRLFRSVGEPLRGMRFARLGVARADDLMLPEVQVWACLDAGLLAEECGDPAFSEYLERSWVAAALEPLPVRCTVSAAAVELWWRRGDQTETARWGERLRDPQTGRPPERAETGLGPAPWAELLAAWALALLETEAPATRKESTLRSADAALKGAEGEDLQDWREKVSTALLQIGRE